MDPTQDICAICLASLTAGGGQAFFTAECSHTFHFNCIADSVQHGNHICPTCRSTWTNLTSQFNPSVNNVRLRPRHIFRQPALHAVNFADDEPLPTPEPTSSPTVQSPPVHSQGGGEMAVKALPEFSALSMSEQSDSFAVLVGIRAPPLSPAASDRPDARAPVDLVAVLDVSGSMDGDKIRLLKEAMNFVVDNLGPTDRLSVISFATTARRVTSLRRMTVAGRADTIQAVNSLRANGCTNIIDGLRQAVQVLDQRRQKNPVASIILLSDGQDNQNGHGPDFVRSLQNLPPCIRANAVNQTPESAAQAEVVPVPVHTFGFGSDHDATALHSIADVSGGTFSYIESIEVIQDAFAQCIGGLLSVVAQEVEIQLHSGSLDARIQSISSGRYRNNVNNDPTQLGTVFIGEVYAEEEKQFLVYISVPQALAPSSEEAVALTTNLLEVKCSYKDPLSNENIMSETTVVQIRRPSTETLTDEDRQVCLEVDRERNRYSIAEGIAEAQALAERGELERAQSLLGHRRMRLQTSASAQAGDSHSGMLDGDLGQIQEMMASKAKYEQGGRAFTYSKGSSHMYQRASTQAVLFAPQQQQQQQQLQSGFGGSVSLASGPPALPAPTAQGSGYQTNFMRKMVMKSQELRLGNPGDKPAESRNSNPI